MFWQKTSKDNAGVKYQSFTELLISCFSFGVSLIEQFIEVHAYIYVFANVDGGSLGHIGTMVQLQRFLINTYISSLARPKIISITYISTLPLWLSQGRTCTNIVK